MRHRLIIFYCLLCGYATPVYRIWARKALLYRPFNLRLIRRARFVRTYLRKDSLATKPHGGTGMQYQPHNHLCICNDFQPVRSFWYPYQHVRAGRIYRTRHGSHTPYDWQCVTPRGVVSCSGILHFRFARHALPTFPEHFCTTCHLPLVLWGLAHRASHFRGCDTAIR